MLAKASCVIGILAAVALTASVADARSVDTKRLGAARASVPAARSSGSVPYDAEGNPYPPGHRGSYSSPDFQLMG
jgi:hypothetical protein